MRATKKISGLKYHLQPTQYISISHYLQIQRAEILFPVRHQGDNGIFVLKTIAVSSFSYCKKTHEGITVKTVQWHEEMFPYYTRRNDLRLYNRMIFAIIIIMFIYSGIVVTWHPSILICHPPVSFVPSVLRRTQMTLSGGKSNSARLTWQQCPQNEHYCYNVVRRWEW